MKFNFERVKEFVALPEGQKMAFGLIFLLSITGSVIVYLNYGKNEAQRERNECIANSKKEVLAIQREYSDSVKVMLQRFEAEKTALYLAAIAKLEKKEAALDEAMIKANRAIVNTRQTNVKLQRITNKVSKIVKDANQ